MIGRAADVLRRVLGIRAYRPVQRFRTLVRTPTRHGARSRNGHLPGLTPPTNAAVERLSQQHRIIRQTMADAAFRWARWQG